MKKKQLAASFALSILGFWFGCSAQVHNSNNHEIWDQLLQSHVSDEGWVNYQGFLSDQEELQRYLQWLSANPPEGQGDKALAYWINAYNAFTIELILQNYPLESIRDMGSKLMIPKISSPWDIRFIEIGGKTYDLNNIEHSILRKEFDDPRIHFSIVCASRSCPRLRNQAYTGLNVEQFLEEDARIFVNDLTRNQISTNQVALSRIFSWYKGDFTQAGSLVDFLNRYATTPIDPDADISFLKYDWSLNNQ